MYSLCGGGLALANACRTVRLYTPVPLNQLSDREPLTATIDTDLLEQLHPGPDHPDLPDDAVEKA